MEWRIFNIVVSLFRWCIGTSVIASGLIYGNWIACVYGVVEVFGSMLSLVNCKAADQGDWSFRGLGVAVCYFSGLIFWPIGSTVLGPLFLLELGFAALRVWCLLMMGASYTAGVPSWVGLVSRGPYSVVRHPLASAAIGMRWCVVLANLSVLNVASAVCFTAAILWSAWLEESYLREGEQWREYSERVRSRFIPGVI